MGNTKLEEAFDMVERALREAHICEFAFLEGEDPDDRLLAPKDGEVLVALLTPDMTEAFECDPKKSLWAAYTAALTVARLGAT